MQEEIEIYHIKKGDTLKSIAQKLGMSDVELRDFHNTNCQKAGLMYFNSLVGIEKMVVPKNYKNPEQIWKERQKKLPNKKLSKTFYAEKYTVKESFAKLGQQRLELDYQLHIKRKENVPPEDEHFIFDVWNSDFKKRKIDVDDKISSLALQCMNVISPIPFEVSKNGGVIGIFESKNLKNKFEAQRQEIEDFFVGEVSQSYLDKFSNALSNEGFILDQLRSTFLNQLMFPSMNSFYKKDGFKVDFSVVQNSFPVACHFETEYTTNENLMVINFSGDIYEKCSLQELLRGIRFNQKNDENVTGQVSLSYHYDTESKQLSKVHGKISLWFGEELYLVHEVLAGL